LTLGLCGMLQAFSRAVHSCSVGSSRK